MNPVTCETVVTADRLVAAERGHGGVANKAGVAKPDLVVRDALWPGVMPKAL